MTRKQNKMLARIVLAAVLTAFLQFIPVTGLARLVSFLAVYLIIGYDILRKAGLGILNGRPFDENFLMAVATIGAFALAVYEKSGDYNEAVAVMLFYQTGEFFQSYAVGRSRRDIAALMDIRPDSAHLYVDGSLETVSPDEVTPGSVIVVQPGEKVPLDGVVISGCSSLDTSALTGESVPRDVARGDEAVSGCINLSGLLHIRTTKAYGESTVSKVLDLVENSSSRKSRSEDFISRFARVYTPVVCVSALLLALLPPLVRLLFLSLTPGWDVWMYRALIFLVISCPCALVVSIPLTFFAGIGGASRQGILVKGSVFLEALSKVKTVVFDKTGTLTRGVFEVSDIHGDNVADDLLLEYAALAESGSSHPISRSLQAAYGHEPDRGRVTDVEEISGHGVTARVDGVTVAAGNSRLMRRIGLEPGDCGSADTVVHLALDGTYAGHIHISDTVKPGSKAAVDALRRSGVSRIVMLTGDRPEVARQVGSGLGVDEVHGGLLPEGKVREVEALLEQGSEGKLAFVGDGINDAPALARADIGVAMGAMGSDAAIEAADVVLMDDDPMKIAKAIRLSRKCMRIVWQNIVFALGVKSVCLLLGALGLAGMWLAVFADVGVMVIAVLNAVRAMRVS